MSNALVRGRTLNPKDVEIAKRWRQRRIQALEAEREKGTITWRERHELSRIGGARHPAKQG